jgi:hypothetical protein
MVGVIVQEQPKSFGPSLRYMGNVTCMELEETE